MRALPTYASVEDVRDRARRRVPRMVFDYVDSGARGEVTLRANRAAFDEVEFDPRVATGAFHPDLSTTLFGRRLELPLLLSPCGGLRAVHPDGEIGAARAAERAGTVFVMSSASGFPIEEIASAVARGSTWFQLYFLGGKSGALKLVQRAQEAQCEALVVTIDTNVVGVRERDVRNGMTAGPYVNGRNIVKFAPSVVVRPRWLLNFVRDGMRVDLANAARLAPDGGAVSPAEASMLMVNEAPSWSDVAWVREQWTGPMLVKGIVSSEDARRALDVGADGVIISNHGGRQLDGAPATLRVLPEIRAAVGDDAVVLLDSGVRRGTDVVKAVALGANAAMIGRAYVYGLAAHGEPGVDMVLDMLRSEIINTMQLLGCPSIADLDRRWLRDRT